MFWQLCMLYFKSKLSLDNPTFSYYPIYKHCYIYRYCDYDYYYFVYFVRTGHHSSWSRNGVPRRKPYRDGADADGGNTRQGFRIQPE